MKNDDLKKETIIDYICTLSGERVDPIPLFNKNEYSFQNLRAIAFRWFCIKHKIKLLDLMKLLDKTRYADTFSSDKLGISKREMKKKNEEGI